MILALLASVSLYQATVLRVVDGDTLRVHVAGWPAPFDPIDVRVYGIDTPEHALPPAKSRCEVALGAKATVFARTLVQPGQGVTIAYTAGRHDKYGRLLGTVTLPDGRDWGDVLVGARFARPYGLAGDLHKAAWC